MRTAATALALALVATTAPVPAFAWTKSYVVSWFELAFRYGGPGDGMADTPGTDCPQLTEIVWEKELATPYRTPEYLALQFSPEHPLTERLTSRAFRGPHRENVYENPTIQPDPGFAEVKGQIAEGFDLDGDPTTGFIGVNGEKGVDNAFYKTSGCIRRWRGLPRTSSTGNFHNDGMRNGMYTILFVVSGQGDDPMNDDKVTVGVYNSSDQIVKDAASLVAHDYTFRVNPDPAFQTAFEASIKNGVLESKAPMLLRTHDHMQGRYDRPWLELHQARVRMTFNEDGTARALIGGYRDWFEHFRTVMGDGGVIQGAGHGSVQGATAEGIGRFNAIGWYHALRRNADGLKDPVTGQNRGISTAYRYDLLPAFVVSPKGDAPVSVAQVFDR